MVDETKQPHRSLEDEFLDPPSVPTIEIARQKALRMLLSGEVRIFFLFVCLFICLFVCLCLVAFCVYCERKKKTYIFLFFLGTNGKNTILPIV